VSRAQLLRPIRRPPRPQAGCRPAVARGSGDSHLCLIHHHLARFSGPRAQVRSCEARAGRRACEPQSGGSAAARGACGSARAPAVLVVLAGAQLSTRLSTARAHTPQWPGSHSQRPSSTQTTTQVPEKETLRALGSRLQDLCTECTRRSPREFESFCRHATQQLEEERRQAEGVCGDCVYRNLSCPLTLMACTPKQGESLACW